MKQILSCTLSAIILSLTHGVRAEEVDIAPLAISVPSSVQNPINAGQPVTFSEAPAYADNNGQTEFRLVADSDNRFEFYFPGTPAEPRRCELRTRMEDFRRGHVEVLRDGEWERVGELTGSNPATLDWEPVLVSAVAIVIEETTDRDHEPMRLRSIRLLSDTPWEMPHAAPTLKLSTTQPDKVFKLGEPIKVSCTIGGDWPTPLHLRWRWDDFLNDPLHPGGEVEAPTDGPITLSWQPDEQGPVLLKASLVTPSGAVVAETWLLVGIRDPAFPGNVPAFSSRLADAPPTRDELIGQDKMLWSAELYIRMIDPTYSAQKLDFSLFKDAGFNVVGAYQNMPWFEPLPGVYNFKTLDRIVKKAEETDIFLELGLWRWDKYVDGGLQPWLQSYLSRGRDGDDVSRMFSPSAESYREAVLRAAEVFVRRYRSSPAVALWYVHPYGQVDHEITSEMLNGEARYDYSMHAVHAYQEYLRQKFGTIATLNAAYGTDYKDFASIEIPKSLAATSKDQAHAGNIVDNRPLWRDYLFFRDDLTVLGLQEQVYKIVRQLDPIRPIAGMSNSMAAQSSAAEIDLRQRYGAFYGDQGLDIPALVRRYLPVIGGGLPFRGEPIRPYSPTRFRGDLKAATGQSLFDGAVVGIKHMQFVFSTWENNPVWEMLTYPPLREAFAANSDATPYPSKAGLLHSFRTGALEGETSYPNIELHRWVELLGWSRTIVKPGLWVEPLMADGNTEGFADKKLIIDNNSRVLEPGVIDALVDFVSQGGYLVIQRTSGEYSDDSPEPMFSLASKLGYPHAASLGNVFATEGVARGEKFLAGMELPLRSLCVLEKPGATVVATVDGKNVALEWKFGKGKVLLFGGIPGYAYTGEIRLLRKAGKDEEANQLWADWQQALERELEGLTAHLLTWAGLPPQGIQSDAPIDVMVRARGETLWVPLRNHSSNELIGITLSLPQELPGATRANAIMVDRTEALIPDDQTGSAWVLPQLDAGEFCLIEFSR
ncbi:MAG: beta-galactosidase [Verrucomicrobiota bacterium JB024]|nr:beta-galactosidase [Verrucomicrobiota bacterium JB024]